jgi:hypothetical protein
MCTSELRHRTSYKLMIYLGFAQMTCLQFCGLNIGVLGLLGVVFCAAPNYTYIFGSGIFGIWVVSLECRKKSWGKNCFTKIY